METKRQKFKKYCTILYIMLLVSPPAYVIGSALATPPQQIKNYEFTPSTTLGAVTLTAKGITLTQTGNANNPGKFPCQSIIISNDGAAGTSDLFVTVTGDVTQNATNTSNQNGSAERHIYAGDPPISIDGRFNFLSIIRGTAGSNANQNARITAIY